MLRRKGTKGILLGDLFVADEESIEQIINEDAICNFIPVGVPFDCMPEWVDVIEVFYDGGIKFRGGTNRTEKSYIDYFKNCPEEWKGKTFPITKELRELLK